MIRTYWPYVAAVLIIAGLISQSAAVAVLGFAIGLACWGAQLWARYALRRVVYERIIPEDHAFAGERVAITLRITNRKPLPLPWIELREQFSEAMVSHGTIFDTGSEFRLQGQVGTLGLEWRTSAGAYERVSRDLELDCPARGVYDIGPATLRSGDAFGLFAEQRDEERRTHVIVYPETVELPDLALPSRRPYGDRAGGLRVFEDPSRVAGVREYRPGDSLRRIDWNATARLGKLQSRVYEPASSRHLLVCLNTQTVIPAWAGFVPDVLERAISVAATIARDAYDTRYSVGLLANSTFPDADRSIRIAPGRRAEQFIRMLEALAVVTPFVLEPLSAMLDREEHRLTIGTTIAVVTGAMPGELAATLLRLHRRGHQLAVLSVTGETWTEDLGSIPVRDVSPAARADARWAPPHEEPAAAARSSWAAPLQEPPDA